MKEQTPPSVRDVRALIEQWREKAASLRNDAVTQQEGGAYEAAAYERGKADARMLDAKELDTLIGSAPQEQDWRRDLIVRIKDRMPHHGPDAMMSMIELERIIGEQK